MKKNYDEYFIWNKPFTVTVIDKLKEEIEEVCSYARLPWNNLNDTEQKEIMFTLINSYYELKNKNNFEEKN